MNPPTLIKKEFNNCSNICNYPLQFNIYSILSQDKNAERPTYVNGFHFIRLNYEGVWEAGTEGSPYYKKRGASFSSVCPHDEPVWIKKNHLRRRF